MLIFLWNFPSLVFSTLIRTYCAFHKHANSVKSQLTIAFFAAVNHLNGLLGNKTLL